MKYSFISLFIFSTLFISCSSSDIKKFSTKTKDETKKVVDKYKGNSPRIIPDNEDSVVVSEDIKNALKLQNDARRDVGIEDKYKLLWSDTIAKDAKSYADELAQSGRFEHDTKRNHASFEDGGYKNGPYGENLYAYFNSNGSVPSYSVAIRSWLDEKDNYNGGVISYDESECSGGQCGHYTQIVWRYTTRVGCARSQYKSGEFKGGYVIVCKYKTPGNVIGESPY